MNVSGDLSVIGRMTVYIGTVVVISLNSIIKFSIFSLHGFGKRAVSVPNDSKSKEERKIGNIRLESHRQMLEEPRITEDPVHLQEENKKLKK